MASSSSPPGGERPLGDPYDPPLPAPIVEPAPPRRVWPWVLVLLLLGLVVLLAAL